MRSIYGDYGYEKRSYRDHETGDELYPCISCGSYQDLDWMGQTPDGFMCDVCHIEWLNNQEAEEVENE